MTRPRTGSAYTKRGVFYIAVSLRPGTSKDRWVRPCPPRSDGVPVDITHARAVAAELQRRYDAGEWDPERDARLPGAAKPVPTTPATATTAASVPEPKGTEEAARLLGVTLIEFARSWIATQRYESAPKDTRVIEHYLAPAPVAAMPVGDLKPKHILAFIRWLQDRPSERGGTLAPRSVRNVYDVVRRALDAAVIEELLPANPCAPIRGRLPAIEDKDPLARQGWLYQRDEIVRLVTDPRILPVRRVSYALQFLTGLRVGELAVLRWKDYDAAMQPLGRLTIARAVKSVSLREAQTKTAAVKLVPVHPTLAVILDAWKASGWAAYMGRAPVREDLVVPNQYGKVRNTNRHNRDLGRDCKRIGIGHRHQHAMRHTFITLVQDDGADGSVIRWITHAPPRTAFDGYTRAQWSRLCAELVKLRVEIPAQIA
ncbi:MAG: tyrosine-type recombinase/integrase [Deltaproteobacteria bacterium]|nr:tyrosine-type recombinase/integrase [Deltaproteobacteria bacterium]